MKVLSLDRFFKLMLVCMHRAKITMPQEHRTWQAIFREICCKAKADDRYPEELTELVWDCDGPSCEDITEFVSASKRFSDIKTITPSMRSEYNDERMQGWAKGFAPLLRANASLIDEIIGVARITVELCEPRSSLITSA